MPWKRADYPPDWLDRVHQVRERAGDRCEFIMANGERCPAENHVWIHRGIEDRERFVECAAEGLFCSGRDVDEAPFLVQQRPIRVVLTTMHVLNDGPIDCEIDVLRYACQWHHNTYDRPMRMEHAKATRARKRAEASRASAQMQLAFGEGTEHPDEDRASHASA